VAGSHTRTNALESLVIASFVRGLSVRDVEATLADALGERAAISKSTVSSICQAIKDQYQTWAARRLDEVKLDYLFLDASFFRMHPGSPAEPVLAAWGITTSGKPAFVGLAPGTGESADAGHDFLDDLKDRGLASPLLVISDGNPGLIGAIEQAFPKALRQRCLVHRARNVLAKIPAGMQAEIKDSFWAIFDTEDLTLGRPETCGDHQRAHRWVRGQIPGPVPGRGQDPAHRPRGPDRLPALPRAPPPHPPLELHRADLRRNSTQGQGHRPAPRRDQLPVSGLGRAGPGLSRLARVHDDQRRPAPAAGPAPVSARPAPPAPAARRQLDRAR
jgi:Transposase, Mutator family